MIRLALLMAALGMATDADATTTEARLTLKKWGLAYCVTTHVEGHREPGGAAMAGYFQTGSHQSEEAYRNVRSFFDAWVVERPSVPKLPGTDLSLMTCINAYESPEYEQVVREQDRFL